jgi:hypothetical protein
MYPSTAYARQSIKQTKTGILLRPSVTRPSPLFFLGFVACVQISFSQITKLRTENLFFFFQ